MLCAPALSFGCAARRYTLNPSALLAFGLTTAPSTVGETSVLLHFASKVKIVPMLPLLPGAITNCSLKVTVVLEPLSTPRTALPPITSPR